MSGHAKTTKAATLRRLLRSGELVVSPGVYDGYSARLVERSGFKTASTTGAGIANSRLGQPDIGILSLLENVDTCRTIVRSCDLPVMADADTGYGNAVTVFHIVSHFEEAGIVGINIEDQAMPKRCGHLQGKQLIPAREMAKKIEAAVAARRDPDFIINARTDAISLEGIDGAIARAKLYAAAGADMIFPDAVKDEDQIKRLVDEVGIPISINMGFGIRRRPTTPLLTCRRLQELGVARVSLPRMLPAAAVRAMELALKLMRQSVETGEVIDRPDLLASIEEITGLMGDSAMGELEKRFLLPEQLAAASGG
ncbi:MAG: isocitrate lyase/PEP mutase family protein [Alphaproteobacteria bacterium]|nr:isocitrate lyase/PEP mutase family protein [Alphaproteobacteria bacterium]